MTYVKPTIEDYGTLIGLTQAQAPPGPEDCGGKHGQPAGHSPPQGPACPSGR
jgi:hypothetical protein